MMPRAGPSVLTWGTGSRWACLRPNQVHVSSLLLPQGRPAGQLASRVLCDGGEGTLLKNKSITINILHKASFFLLYLGLFPPIHFLKWDPHDMEHKHTGSVTHAAQWVPSTVHEFTFTSTVSSAAVIFQREDLCF